jgi:outer membrane protein assembly factor BamB
LYEGRIYIVNDNEGQSFLEAIDPATGETIWRVDRDEKSNWSTPFIWRNRVRTEIVTSSSGRVRSYDLEGNELWSLTGMSGITIPTPISGGDLVYISSGFDASRYRPVYAIRSGAQGDITLEEGRTSNAFIAWSQPKAAAYNPSPLLYQGQVYVLLDNGKLSSFDAETGREVYIGQKIHADADAFTSSPWASGGKIFCLSEDGDTFVIQAGPEMKLIRINPLGEMGMASPALIPGSLILRTREALYRISEP